MSDDNPYRAPTTAIGSDQRRRSRPVGPVLTGIVAIVSATILVGGGGLLASIVAVVSWWVYKFWPRPPAPEAAGIRAHLQQLERSPLVQDVSAEPGGPATNESPSDVFRDLRL